MKKFKLLTIILIFLNSSIGFTVNKNTGSPADKSQEKKYSVTISSPYNFYGLEQQFTLKHRQFIAEKCLEPIRIARQKEELQENFILLCNIIAFVLVMYYLYRESIPMNIRYRRLGIQQERQWLYRNQFII
jgi:hypothetical protein